jgi:hypothetical protein
METKFDFSHLTDDELLTFDQLLKKGHTAGHDEPGSSGPRSPLR